MRSQYQEALVKGVAESFDTLLFWSIGHEHGLESWTWLRRYEHEQE